MESLLNSTKESNKKPMFLKLLHKTGQEGMPTNPDTQ